jgi:Cu(I)/Ag(I) efflux system protein CusF
MNTIKTFFAISALAMSVALPITGFAQASMAGMDHSKMMMSQTASMTDGEIRKIDKDAGKLTIKHGEIKHMDMPGMTMVFTVKDKALLDNVKVGDKIQFMVINEDGKMVVTQIQPAKAS